jgi:hypothetical protein
MDCRLLASPRISGAAVAIVASACVGFLCAGCAQDQQPVTATTAAASRPVTATTTPASLPITTASATPSAQPAKLVADAKVRHEVLAAFIAFRSNAANTPGYAAIPPSAVAGISPRTLSYAFDSSTGIYWATASFSATAAASQTSAFIGFQDGGNSAVFMRPPGQPWRVESVGPCLKGLPVVLAKTLGLNAGPNPMCPSGVPAG